MRDIFLDRCFFEILSATSEPTRANIQVRHLPSTRFSGAIPFGQMASRKGVEPLTPGLGNQCSIQLSYRDNPCFRYLIRYSAAAGTGQAHDPFVVSTSRPSI